MIRLFDMENIQNFRRPLFLLLYFMYLLQVVSSETIADISDGSIVNLSLKYYNVSDSNNEKVEFQYVMKPRSSCVIQVNSIPSDAYFVLVQVHSYMKNLTLSYSVKPTQKTRISGVNIGLISLNTTPKLKYYLTYNTSDDDVEILIVVQAYSKDAPIPGGCNMEFPVEISPFQKIVYDDSITMVDFAPASHAAHIIANIPINFENPCDLKHSSIVYKTYRLYLPGREFSPKVYFNALKLMLTNNDIMKNGKLIPNKSGVSPVRHFFASYPGTGSVFAVIAETAQGSSAYVPAFTDSCSPDGGDNSCIVLTTTFSKLLCAAVFFLGLVTCFTGHRFFTLQLVLSGFTLGVLVSYIAVLNLLEDPNALLISIGVGLGMGCLFLIGRYLSCLPLFSLIVTTSILGFLFASSVYYYLVDVFDEFESDINYWSLFVMLLLLPPILMISLSKKANIVACSVVGSYVAIVAVDYYIGSNLRYIVINVIRRATNQRFASAVIDPPFMWKDAVLVASWIILSAVGIITQLYLVKGKAPYPAPHGLPFKIKRSAPALNGNGVANETTPLLHSWAERVQNVEDTQNTFNDSIDYTYMCRNTGTIPNRC